MFRKIALIALLAKLAVVALFFLGCDDATDTIGAGLGVAGDTIEESLPEAVIAKREDQAYAAAKAKALDDAQAVVAIGRSVEVFDQQIAADEAKVRELQAELAALQAHLQTDRQMFEIGGQSYDRSDLVSDAELIMDDLEVLAESIESSREARRQAIQEAKDGKRLVRSNNASVEREYREIQQMRRVQKLNETRQALSVRKHGIGEPTGLTKYSARRRDQIQAQEDQLKAQEMLRGESTRRVQLDSEVNVLKRMDTMLSDPPTTQPRR